MKGILEMALVLTSAFLHYLMRIWSVRDRKPGFILSEAPSGEIVRNTYIRIGCIDRMPGVLPSVIKFYIYSYFMEQREDADHAHSLIIRSVSMSIGVSVEYEREHEHLQY